jgi:PAS domain S-box-containing protein
MDSYAGFLLLSSLTCMFSGLIVYQLNRKERLNRLFAYTFFFAAYWALTDFLMRNSTSTNEAYFWSKTSFLWPFTLALLFHFSLIFTKNRLLNHKASYAVIYTPAVFLSIIDLTTGLISGPIISEYFGFTYSVPSNPLFYLIGNIWGVILGGLSLFVCIRYYYQIEEKSSKESIKLVTVGFAIPFIVNVSTTVIPPYFNINVPSLGNVSMMFVSVFVGYAVYKYYLFSLNPALAAENIIATMPDLLILTNPQGLILRVNQSLVKLTSFFPEELNGKSLTTLFIDEKQGRSTLAALAKGKTIKDFEVSFRTKSGEIRIVEFSGSAVEGKQGQNLGFTCVVHNITQLKQIQEKLAKAERLVFIGELAGQIGHDLRNPLAGIKNGIYYLRKKGAAITDAERDYMIGIIDSAVSDSDRIINSLVEYSSDLRLEMVTCTPKSILASALQKVEVPKRITIVDNTSSEHTFLASVSGMIIVFANIIKNAVVAIPETGTLTVQSSQTIENITISFTDSGIGIPEEFLPKIFSPLFTTKAKGMGMSLSNCKRIIEAHRGKITVESVSGKGATFTITIPRINQNGKENCQIT